MFSKTGGTDYVGGVIDNAGLDGAILGDRSTEEYPLEQLDFSLISELQNDHEKGTIIYFEGTNEQLKNSDAYIKKLLALSFKFSLLDEEFTIHVGGDPVTVDDLKPLSDATQFLWSVNGYTDTYTDGLNNLELPVSEVTTPLDQGVCRFGEETG